MSADSVSGSRGAGVSTRLRRRWAAALAAASILGALSPSGVIAVGAADFTGAFVYDNDALRSLTSTDFTFEITSGTDLNSVGVRVTRVGGSPTWTFEFEALPGEVLTTGTYLDAKNGRFAHAGLPGFFETGEGRGCSNFDTDFTINELLRDGAGN